MERDLHNHSWGAEAVFQQTDDNVSKLEECINCHRSKTRKMEVQQQKQRVMIQDLMMKIGALEAREADREEQIAVQEDTIQILLVEVEELKGKMYCCHDSPCISHGSSQAESPYELEGESSGSSYVLAPVEGSLILIQGGERRGESIDLDSVDLNNVVPDVPMIGFRTFLDDMVVEGPYRPLSTSNTLIDVPHDLPSLENMEPIPIPAVCLQHAVWSQGCPKSDYHSPFQSGSPSYLHCPGSPHYHPYCTPVPAAKEFVSRLGGSCQCLCCCSPEPAPGGSSSGSSTGL